MCVCVANVHKQKRKTFQESFREINIFMLIIMTDDGSREKESNLQKNIKRAEDFLKSHLFVYYQFQALTFHLNTFTCRKNYNFLSDNVTFSFIK